MITSTKQFTFSMGGENSGAPPPSRPAPSNDVSKEVDELVASSLRQMSLQEREQVLNGIHGVEDDMQENQAMLDTSLQRLRDELDSYLLQQLDIEQEAPALCRVLLQSPNYVRSNDFLLMFLRATSFDVRHALKRMHDFFELKLKLFGVDALGRDVTILHDFSNEDLDTLRCGYTHLLRGRDSAGRAICFLLSHRRAGRSCKSIAKSWYYIIMSALEDVKTQQKGLCLIKYDTRKDQDDIKCADKNQLRRRVAVEKYSARNDTGSDVGKQDLESDRLYYDQMSKFHEFFPLRLMALHVCYINPDFNLSNWFSVVVANYARFDRAKIRFHRGPHMECQYELMTFGIPQCLLPVSLSGEVNLDHHHEWILSRKKREEFLLNVDALASVVSDSLAENTDDNKSDDSQSTSLEMVRSSSLSSFHSWSNRDDVGNVVDTSFDFDTSEIMMSFAATDPAVTSNVSDANGDSNANHRYGSSSHHDKLRAEKAGPIIMDCKTATSGTGNGQKNSVAVLSFTNTVKQPKAARITASKKAAGGGNIVIPNHEDILLGRGNINHYGNLRFRQLIDQYQQEYEDADKVGKTNVAEKIVQVIKSSGGRFLKKNGNGWIQECDEKSRYCVSHRFRNMRRLGGAGSGATAANAAASLILPPSPIHSIVSEASVDGDGCKSLAESTGYQKPLKTTLPPTDALAHSSNKRRGRPIEWDDYDEGNANRKGPYFDATASTASNSGGFMGCLAHSSHDKPQFCFSPFPIFQQQHTDISGNNILSRNQNYKYFGYNTNS